MRRLISRSKRYFSKVVNFLRFNVTRFITRIYKITAPIIRRWPWKKIGIIASICLVVAWSLLQFYLATPSRIIKGFNQNLATHKEVSNEMEEVNKSASSLSSEQLSDFETKMNKIADNINSKYASLPPRFFTWYAFLRAPGPLKEQINRLYGQNKFNTEVIKISADTISETARLSKELLDKGESAIHNDTDGYIAFLEQSTKILDNIDKSDKASIEVPRKIFSFIYLAAKDYQATGNKENFSLRYSNLSSELAEETGLAWVNSTREQQNNINTHIQTLESIINEVEN